MEKYKWIFEYRRDSLFYAGFDDVGHKQSVFAGQPLYHIKDISKDDVQIGEEFPFSYDVSNNRITVSVAIDGKIIEAASVSDVEEQYGVWMRGVYVKKKLVRKKLLDVQIGEGKVLESAKTQLIANTFPISSYCCENGYIEKVTFAPFSFKKAIVFQIVRVVNTGNEPTNYQAISSMSRLEGEESTNVQPGEDYIWVFAMSAEGDAKHILRDQQGKYMEPNQLFQDSLDIAQNRYGTFSVSDSYYNDAFIRMGELCRQSLMTLSDGRFAGSYLGSNPTKWEEVWMKDCSYGAMSVLYFDGELGKQAARYFLKFGLVPYTWDRGRNRFPEADPITHSLCNALAGIQLAVAHYQLYGDKGFIKEIMPRAKMLMERVYATRYEEELLFPSMYISDGDARGDAHLGSNVIVWYCMKGFGRFQKEVMGDSESYDLWNKRADKVKDAIQRRMKGAGILGEQYYEGMFFDGSFAAGHDGEESDVSLMPYYGFTTDDDPALLNFSRQIMSPVNPLYVPETDAVGWYDEEWWSKSTFSAFVSSLAAASSEQELEQEMEKIKKLTDLDGSVWWWSHGKNAKDFNDVYRNHMKSCWSAGTYMMRLISTIIGIKPDVPRGEVCISPFLPWKEFEWKDAAIGKVKLDFKQIRNMQEIRISVKNKCRETYLFKLDVLLEPNEYPKECLVNGIETGQSEMRIYQRFGRMAVRICRELQEGEEVTVRVMGAVLKGAEVHE